MKKKMISLLLVLALVVGICPAAFAGETVSPEVEDFSFIDAEGKVNTIYMSSEQPGTSHVDYYIEGVLVSQVDVALLGGVDRSTGTLDDTTMVAITHTDVKSGVTTHSTELVSRYIVSEEVEVPTLMAATPRVSVYQGRINYKTCYDMDGNVYNDSLYIYCEEGRTKLNTREVNATAGDAIETVVAIIGTALTFVDPIKTFIAKSLLNAIIYTLGVNVVGSEIRDSFTEEYIVRETPCTVKARDVKTSRENTYQGCKYQVVYEEGDYSSEYVYEGYMLWNTDEYAYYLFLDFWGYAYPGVKSYS